MATTLYIRFSDKELYSYSQNVDIVFALNEKTIELHISKLKKDGFVIADRKISKEKDIVHLPLDYKARK